MSIQLHSEHNQSVLLLHLTGRLDSLNSSHIESDFLSHIKNSSGPILINLHGLDYMASAGLRLILMAAKQAKAQNLDFALCGLQPHVHHVFEISGFFNIMTAYPDQEAALQALAI